MSAALTTQMLTPSLRRVYRSRAACTAISSSGACSEPTCTWLSPRLPRTNTSYSGHSRRGAAGLPTGTPGPVGTAPCPPSAVSSLMRASPCSRLASGLVPLLGRRRCSLARPLRGIGGRRLGHPRVVVARGTAARDPLGVAGAAAGQDPRELRPVDRPE